MSLMTTLNKTFEDNIESAGDITQKSFLCPISHMIANAQIEVSVGKNGEFKGARTITDKEEGKTLIPITEDSAGRASGIAPHPLCDNLTYVAGDYNKYAKTKEAQDLSKKRFNAYIEALKKWDASLYGHEKVTAIYKYLSKEVLAEDLIKSGVLAINDGMFSKEKILGQPYEKCIVRFKVVEKAGNSIENCWQDETLVEAFQKYYFNEVMSNAAEDVCYITGDAKKITTNHPKGIIPSSYGAKLVSANDNTDFTYRGRFKTGEEACAVSYEASQQAHNALKWLANMQGYTIGTQDKQTYICWNPKGKKVPAPDEFGYENDVDYFQTDNMTEYRDELIKFFEGKKKNFDISDIVALASLEAATTGRLSVLYYGEMPANDYFDRIEKWHESCCWKYRRFDAGGNMFFTIETPSLSQIIRCAFGVEYESKENKATKLVVKDKLFIMQYQRLFRCKVERQPVPRDIVENLFRKCSNPEAYSYSNREKILSTACALIRKYFHDRNDEEGIGMEVNRDVKDRDYLYGRLLAVYEQVERRAYQNGEKRAPHAIKLQAKYVQHPASTRLIIETRLKSSYEKLEKYAPKLCNDYRNEIEEISNDIGLDNGNKALGYKYLTGYWAERADLRKGNKQEEKKEEEI